MASSSSSSKLPKMHEHLDNILATHVRGKDLQNQIHNFPLKAQQIFFDQVIRRYPQEPDVPAHIEQGGNQTLNSYLRTVEELLHCNPYRGFSPPIIVDDMFKRTIVQYLNSGLGFLTYGNKMVVLAHVYDTLIRYTGLISNEVSGLFVLSGYVEYRYKERDFKVYINIFLPASYPKDPPHVRIDCRDGWIINPDHMNIAPNGLVLIPYIVNWDEQSCDLVQLLSHLCLEFTCQPPMFPIDDGRMALSTNQKKLLRIIMDYQITHLFNGVQALTHEKRSGFFKEVTGRYPQVPEVDLPDYIRTTKGGVKKFIYIVAELLELPPKTRSTVDVEDHHFLP